MSTSVGVSVKTIIYGAEAAGSAKRRECRGLKRVPGRTTAAVQQSRRRAIRLEVGLASISERGAPSVYGPRGLVLFEVADRRLCAQAENRSTE